MNLKEFYIKYRKVLIISIIVFISLGIGVILLISNFGNPKENNCSKGKGKNRK